MRVLMVFVGLAALIASPATAAENKRQWRVERVWDAAKGETVPLTPAASARTSGSVSVLGKLTVETGCNTVFARGWPSGKAIKFGTPWTTKKPCDGEALAIETGLVQALTLARVYEDPRFRIILRDAAGREVLALAKR